MVVDTTIAGITVGDAHPVRIMGAINLSRESFYKGSVTELENVVPAAEQMVAEGADFIDVGARSTWPLADKITKEEERKRLIPALEQLTANVDVPISVDTQCADLARDALEMGVRIVNDVSGLTADPGMVEVVHEYGCPVVVMASDKVPGVMPFELLSSATLKATSCSIFFARARPSISLLPDSILTSYHHIPHV